jgi:LysR family transcriptional regulator, glycine cleavage system transcriptional activator
MICFPFIMQFLSAIKVMRHLPPLRTLLAFETTARHLSVGRAAEELCISPSAVSHQLRTIEDFLGVRLFHRTTRTMQLTDAGYNYLQLVTGGLERLATATHDIVDAGFTDVLTIQCPPSFAPAWLVPRLGSFVATNSDIDLRIRARPDPVDILRSAVDIEIRYRLGETAGLVVEPLLQEAIVPLAKPVLARRLRGKSVQEALSLTPLIHSERSPKNWTAWLRSQNISRVNVARGLRFDRAYLSIQAAIDGLGVALESTVFAARAIEAKQLVRLFPSLPEPTEFAHYFVCSEANAHLPKIRKFKDWILREAKKEGGA